MHTYIYIHIYIHIHICINMYIYIYMYVFTYMYMYIYMYIYIERERDIHIDITSQACSTLRRLTGCPSLWPIRGPRIRAYAMWASHLCYTMIYYTLHTILQFAMGRTKVGLPFLFDMCAQSPY